MNSCSLEYLPLGILSFKRKSSVFSLRNIFPHIYFFSFLTVTSETVFDRGRGVRVNQVRIKFDLAEIEITNLVTLDYLHF